MKLMVPEICDRSTIFGSPVKKEDGVKTVELDDAYVDRATKEHGCTPFKKEAKK